MRRGRGEPSCEGCVTREEASQPTLVGWLVVRIAADRAGFGDVGSFHLQLRIQPANRKQRDEREIHIISSFALVSQIDMSASCFPALYI